MSALRPFTGPIRPCGPDDPQVVPPSTIRGRTIVRRNLARQYMRYGRGRRSTARRSALVPSATPISASSSVAWAAVLSIGVPLGGSVVSGGRRRAREVEGTPRGWAGCGSRSRRAAVARVVRGVAGVARPAVPGLAFGLVARCGFERVAVGSLSGLFGRTAAASASAAATVELSTSGAPLLAERRGARSGRFGLRRCGRVRGSCPRRSDERSSVIRGWKRGSYCQLETDLGRRRKQLYWTAEDVPENATPGPNHLRPR
jgi:hypothetical protein